MTITGNAVATRDGNGIAQPSATLAIRPGQEFWTDKQRAALAVLGIRNATNADLAVYMHYCQKTGLDPFSRQIYMICRREKQGDQWVDKQTIQVGIDGFRVIRDRVAARLGIEVEYEDTTWYDHEGGEHAVWLSDQPPAACRVVVLKNGRRFPAVLRTSAYAAVSKDGNLVAQWRTQADHMIEKCAEAFALRRAFPHDLGGIYVEEETGAMAQAAPIHQRVTAADITGQRPPEDVPGPETGNVPATQQRPAGSEAGAGPGTPKPKGQPAPPAAVKRMEDLIAQLQLGPPRDVDDLINWLCPGYAATRAEVKRVTDHLAGWLESAQGDIDAASDGIWTQMKQAQARDAGEPAEADHG